MTQHNLTVEFTARYSKIGDVTKDTRQIWFVLHGYGQLAPYFIRKFAALGQHGICVIAPEGLSRFYLEDVNARNRSGNNRVGASWMTREERETDILNYVRYLDAVYQQEVPDKTIPVTVLGFSQGSATASRWVSTSDVISFQKLILWAGVFPPDMNIEASTKKLNNKAVAVVYGTQDPFLKPAHLDELKDIASRLHVSPQVISFDGVHEIHEPTLLGLI